jgi:hypothetical protein
LAGGCSARDLLDSNCPQRSAWHKTSEELINFGKNVRKLAENPFERQDEAVRSGSRGMNCKIRKNK